jgi:hypothetical protein
MAGYAETAVGIHMVNENLGVDPLLGEGIDAPGGDVTVGREIFHTQKNGEIFLLGIFCGKFPQTHAVVVGDANRIQTLGLGNGDDQFQIDEAVQRISAFVQVHIN